MTTDNSEVITRSEYWGFLQALASGDVSIALQSFAGNPDVDDPILGRHVGEDRLARLAEHWRQREGLRAEEIKPLHLTETEDAALLEFAAPLAPVLHPEKPVLDGAVVFTRTANGFGSVRIYFATAGFLGHHVVRGRLLADEEESHRYCAPVEHYQSALRESRLEDLLDQLSPAARVRGGDSPTAKGTDEVRAFFTGMFHTGGGGFHLEHAGVFQDEQSVVLEFTATRWGTHQIAPQSGVAVYTVGADDLISDIRIYDEISPFTPVTDLGMVDLMLTDGVHTPLSTSA